MSQYLRDITLKCLTVHDDVVRKINEDLVEIAKKKNAAIPAEAASRNDKLLIPTYIIRFDGKGFRLHGFEQFDQVMKYFADAQKVERLMIVLQSVENLKSNSSFGPRVEIRLDQTKFDNCLLTVDDDDRDWVDLVFMKLNERFARCSNRNWIVRNQWMAAVVQLVGVVLGFLASMWFGVVLGPKLKIDSAILFAFIAAFLIFSNAWTFILGWIWALRDYCWPNLSFRKPSTVHWLFQTLIATSLLSVIGVGLSKFVGHFLNAFRPFLN